MFDTTFVPADATVKVGQKVKVLNEDAVEHTLTADDGSFDTGLLGKGESKTITVKKRERTPTSASRTST